MKKLLNFKALFLGLLSLLSVIFISSNSVMHAQESSLTTDIPFSGVYVNQEATSEIKELYFYADQKVVLISLNPDYTGLETIFPLYSALNNPELVITPQKDHDAEAEALVLNQIMPDYAQIYAAVAEEITPSTPFAEAEVRVNFKAPGLYRLEAFNWSTPRSDNYILSQPLIESQGQDYFFNMYNLPVLALTSNLNDETLVNERGQIFEKTADTLPELDALIDQ